MSLKHFIATYFNNHAETNENHWNTALQTHYYKTTKEKGLQEIEMFFRQKDGYDVHSISREHGEISVNVRKGRKAFIIVTVIMVRPYQTAIDLTVTSDSFFPLDFGYCTKCIKQLYRSWNQLLPLVDSYDYRKRG